LEEDEDKLEDDSETWFYEVFLEIGHEFTQTCNQDLLRPCDLHALAGSCENMTQQAQIFVIGEEMLRVDKAETDKSK
jgi:hypothetical protein